MKILITGATGFLGRELSKHLFYEGHNISIVVRQTSNLTSFNDILSSLNVYRIGDDLSISEVFNRVMPDIVIHTACNYGRKNESMLDVFKANYLLGLELLDAISNQDQKVSFINIGTVLPADTNLYSFSKYQFLQLGAFLNEKLESKLKFINVLMQHIYGPGDDLSKFTTYVVRSCINNEKELRLTAGEHLRDFIYIKDAVSAINLICANSKTLKVTNFELGSGRLVSIKEFVELVHKLSKSKTFLNFGAIPYRGDESKIAASNIDNLLKLGWNLKYSLKNGLTETINLEKK